MGDFGQSGKGKICPRKNYQLEALNFKCSVLGSETLIFAGENACIFLIGCRNFLTLQPTATYEPILAVFLLPKLMVFGIKGHGLV